MKFSAIIGVLLIVLGIFAVGKGAIHYTTQEKVLDIGPIEATATKNKTIPLSPLFGVISLVGGISILVLTNKNKNVG